MRCQRKVRHDHRSRTTQFDLFAAPGAAAVPTPGWSALPEEARRALTHLMAQLFLDHADGAREYELDLLRQRSLSARYEKARRGPERRVAWS